MATARPEAILTTNGDCNRIQMTRWQQVQMHIRQGR